MSKTKEEIAAYNRQYYLAHKEQHRAYGRAYYWANVDKCRAKSRENSRAYRLRHPEKITASNKKYWSTHKESSRERFKKYCSDNEEKMRACRRERRAECAANTRNYRKRHPERVRESRRKTVAKRRIRDVDFRLYESVRGCMRYSLKKKSRVHSRWTGYVGYSIDQLKAHLESLFQPGMSWDNYGEWEIDHIIPRSYFSVSSMSDPAFRACWSLDNLRPLWAAENLRKGARLPVECSI